MSHKEYKFSSLFVYGVALIGIASLVFNTFKHSDKYMEIIKAISFVK